MKKLILILTLVLAIMFMVGEVKAEISKHTPTQAAGYIDNYTFFATTTSATSTDRATASSTELGIFKIAGAKNVTLYFSRYSGSGNSGSSTFSIQVTPDGTNWYDYNTLGQNLASSTYYRATVRNVVIEAATTTVVSYMDRLGFYGVRCIVAETTDGTHTCKATAEY